MNFEETRIIPKRTGDHLREQLRDRLIELLQKDDLMVDDICKLGALYAKLEGL